MRHLSRMCVLCLLLALVLQVTFAAMYTEDDDDEDGEDEFDFMSINLDSFGNHELKHENDVCIGDLCVSEDESDILSVSERNLVTTTPRIKDILQECDRPASDVTRHSFAGESLGYVTPWNNRGYDYAKTFRSKFTYISPVWLQIRETADKQPIITGVQDIDIEWIKDVKYGIDRQDSKDGGPKIVPRVVYERNTLKAADVDVIVDQLTDLMDEHDLDGMVLEMPTTEGTLPFIKHVGTVFQEVNKLFLLVLTQASKEGKLPVSHDILSELLPVVHRFSMNAYDYQSPGPNAPLPWIQSTISQFTLEEKQKVLMGIPFYGYDQRDAITASKYLETLQQSTSSRLSWDNTAHECHHQYIPNGRNRKVYFPCLQFLHDRLHLYQTSSIAGTAIWELGQGLDYFYDLL